MRRRSNFDTVRVVGGLLPPNLLDQINAQDDRLEASSPTDYYLAPGERLGEAITRSWNRLLSVWERFSARLEEDGALTGATRQEWLLPLFDELGFGHLNAAPGFEVEGKSYPISHLWDSTPIHLVGVGVDLDRRSPGVAGAAAASPHGLVQEFLNRSEDYLWGIVSNGRRLRLLRDNASLTRAAYVEFDLEEMFGGDAYSDFALLWLVCHASRLEGPAGKQVLERWREDAARQGVRALDALRDGVEEAIETLGTAVVSHPDNLELRTRLDDGNLDAQELYRQILRVVYRFLFLLVAEARDLLLLPDADPIARARYDRHYSITRLRELAEVTRGGAHGDLWRQHLVVARALESTGEPALGLPALGGFLWSQEGIDALNDVTIPNEALLAAIRALTTVQPPGQPVMRVDYANLGAEELGSIYESLLEYVPEVNLVAGTFELKPAAGSERKTTGSYYTPTSLINVILDSALDPVLDEAAKSENPEQAILNLKVVDPAAGSGHFLIAAAHRIADRLARERSDGAEPSPDQLRTALRDVIGHCIYAVDVNPMAVELAKVALWIEAMEPGKPLTFLDHHIQTGNSLLGVTPELLEEGIPDAAFKVLTGDDKDRVKALRSRNRQERKRKLVALTFGDTTQEVLEQAAKELAAIDDLPDTSLEDIAEKQRRFEELVDSAEQRRLRFAADAWVAAFVGPKNDDTPAITTAVLNAVLNDPDAVSNEVEDYVVDLRRRLGFHHWHIAFPDVFAPREPASQDHRSGGFDVVLGNPPWERVKLQEKEFFATSAPEIAKAPNKAARTRLIDELKTENPRLWQEFQEALHDAEAISHFLRTSGVYPLCGRGDVNTYAVFAELMRSLIGSSGRVGVIVPTGIATDDTTKHFFADLVDRRSLVSLFDFENRRAIFPEVHRSYKFCLLTLTGEAHPVDEAEFCFFALDTTDLQDPDRRFTLTPDDFALLNPNTKTCPIFRTRRDAEITKGIYRRVPVLVDETRNDGNPWGIAFQRMFDMSNDSHLFRTRDQLEDDGWVLRGNIFEKDGDRFLPLYEDWMIDHFDHRRQSDGEREATESEKANPMFAPIPRYWVPSAEVASRHPTDYSKFAIAFRNRMRSTDSRSCIGCVIPPYGAGNVVPLIRCQPGDEYVLTAALSSFVFDYVTRLKAGGMNLNFFILRQLPVPTIDSLSAIRPWDEHNTITEWISFRARELILTSFDLVDLDPNVSEPFVWRSTRRVELRAELDAAFFHLYGIERDDVDYIMETFPIVKRQDIAEHGSYRTKELILHVYDRMAEAIETGEPYQTILDPPPADPSLQHPVGAHT